MCRGKSRRRLYDQDENSLSSNRQLLQLWLGNWLRQKMAYHHENCDFGSITPPSSVVFFIRLKRFIRIRMLVASKGSNGGLAKLYQWVMLLDELIEDALL